MRKLKIEVRIRLELMLREDKLEKEESRQSVKMDLDVNFELR